MFFPFAMTMIFGVKMNIFSKEKSDKEVSDYLNAMVESIDFDLLKYYW